MVAYDNDTECTFFFHKQLSRSKAWGSKKLLSNCSGSDCLYVEATKNEFYIIASNFFSWQTINTQTELKFM